MNFQLGCYNRPWREHPFEEALKGISSAGFNYIGFMAQADKGESRQLITADSSKEEINNLITKVENHGLTPVTIIGKASYDLLDNVKQAGMKYLLTTGGYSEELKDLAQYAGKLGITIMIKPHGGPSPSGRDCLEVVNKVNSPYFKICYDPGNVMSHTDVDPAEEITDISREVVAVCVKDYKDGSIGVTPGDGEVDFETIFKELDNAGFSGPIVVETLGRGDNRIYDGDVEKSGSVSEINEEAKRAYKFLNNLLNSI